MQKAISAIVIRISLLTILTVFISCSDSVKESDVIQPDPPVSGPIFNIEKNEFNLSFERTEFSAAFNTNLPLEDISIKNDSKEWCHVEIKKTQEFLFSIDYNFKENIRSSTVSILNKGKELTKIKINQASGDIQTNLNDTKVHPIKASATNEEPSSTGDYSPMNMIDNNFNTRFNSKFSDFNDWPFELSFEFEGDNKIDYIIHHPRQDSDNKGIIGKVSLYIATKENPELIKVGDYDWRGQRQYSIISLTTPFYNVKKVVFKVHSAIGKRVSCAEMEFFEKLDNSKIPLFKDMSCSELKDGITREDIDSCDDELLKTIAYLLLDSNYDKEFRIQEYRPYQHPDVMADVTKSRPKSLRDNITGIYIDDLSEMLIVCVGESQTEGLSLNITDLDNVKSDIHPLRKGINIIKPNNKGHIYIYNHTSKAIPLHPTAKEVDNYKNQSVKIHIVSGKVNGYFDSQKHDTNFWNQIIEGHSYGTSRDIDILGKYTHVVWNLNDYRNYQTDIIRMIELFDEAVYAQMKFLGLVKYNKLFNNRFFIHVLYPTKENVGAYATNYRTAYNWGGSTNYSEVFCSPDKFRTRNWVIGHEVGHTNQITPGLKWHGCTEVTNNITALLNDEIANGGITTKLIKDNHYNNAFTYFINEKHSWFHQDKQDKYNRVMEKLVPFWQLKLYFHDVLNMTDFYSDVAEHARTTDYNKLLKEAKGSTIDGVIMLDFVKTVCHVTKIDLTDFFTKWGFLRPFNGKVDDYSLKTVVVTQKDIDEIISLIKAQNYSVPNKPIHTINDVNIQNFK